MKPIKVNVEIDTSFHAPTKIPKKIDLSKEEAAPPPPSQGVAGMSGMTGGTGGIAGVMGGFGNAPAPVVKAAPPKGPLRISSGVATGNILVKTQPTYPPIAKAAHVSGAVVLRAIISKTGTIDNLSVISGPEMLRASALDAVRQWKYKPYLLNGEPTEVDTQITVNFNFGGG